MGNGKAVAITAELVSAYLAHNAVGADELPQLARHVPELIRQIHEAFARLPDSPALTAHRDVQAEEISANAASQSLRPAVPIAESVTQDRVVCLEDGLTFRSLRPHLISAHGLTPDAYRLRWGLAHNHPIVAPSYAYERSQVAKRIELGRGGRGGQPSPPQTPR